MTKDATNGRLQIQVAAILEQLADFCNVTADELWSEVKNLNLDHAIIDQLYKDDPAGTRDYIVMQAVARCISALDAYRLNDVEGAWSLFSEAKFDCGMLSGFIACDRVDHKKEALSKRARENARKSHAETYAMQEEVISFWSREIGPIVANEKAANILIKHFPLSHRTLSGYVAAEKSKLRASKA